MGWSWRDVTLCEGRGFISGTSTGSAAVSWGAPHTASTPSRGTLATKNRPDTGLQKTASALKRNSQGLLLAYNRSELFRSLNIEQNHTTKQRQSRVTSGQQKCRNTVRKAKEQNELQLVWNIKGTQKDAMRSEKQSGQVMVQQRGTAKMMQSRVGCNTLNICLNFHK